ncbi:proteasomal ubiquitin receptor ADRM1-like [Lineus longissimus]|uniref:proteasomal ubiquitin receptor ADRM1-like n=1 Tax=Lineus longissimus TaxID=88925 RepID=UPI002B4E8C9C
MASGALFGNAASRGTSSGRNLVEFRAGKMYMKGKMVHPDKRKGLVYVHQSDDSLMHFCWKDRTSGVVEDDLIIFPDDIEFKHVPACTTGRVYILKFKLSSRKFFFWVQEPKSDKDEENCRKVNEFLNNPPTPGSTRGGGGGGGGGGGSGGLGGLPPELAGLSGDSDLQGILGNMSQQQLMQLLGGMGMGGLGGMSNLLGRPGSAQSTDSASATPVRVQSSPGPRTTTAAGSGTSTTPASTTSSSTPTTTTPSASTGATPAPPALGRQSSIQLTDLQNILSNLSVPAQKDNVDLSHAMPAEAIIPLLSNPETQQRLIQFLPEAETLPRNETELRATIQSPQFQQALSTFSSALASGQLGPLMQEFGLGDAVVTAAVAGDVPGFVKALEEEDKKKKDSAEKMEEGDKE